MKHLKWKINRCLRSHYKVNFPRDTEFLQVRLKPCHTLRHCISVGIAVKQTCVCRRYAFNFHFPDTRLLYKLGYFDFCYPQRGLKTWALYLQHNIRTHTGNKKLTISNSNTFFIQGRLSIYICWRFLHYPLTKSAFSLKIYCVTPFKYRHSLFSRRVHI